MKRSINKKIVGFFGGEYRRISQGLHVLGPNFSYLLPVEILERGTTGVRPIFFFEYTYFSLFQGLLIGHRLRVGQVARTNECPRKVMLRVRPQERRAHKLPSTRPLLHHGMTPHRRHSKRRELSVYICKMNDKLDENEAVAEAKPGTTQRRVLDRLSRCCTSWTVGTCYLTLNRFFYLLHSS